MAENQITSFTPSELLHGLTLGYLDDPDDYTPEEYLAAYDIAKSAHREQYEAANPTAAQVERQRVLRKIEAEKGSSS